MNKLPISAFIVSKDEGHLLENCLKSILFCDEIIVINLQSSDNTIAISEKYGARVLTVAPLPIVEMIHQKYIANTKNDWVLITDPDEVTSKALAKQISKDFSTYNDSIIIGVVDVPIKYFFKSHGLIGTTWGGIKNRKYLIHKNRFEFKANVHKGGFLKNGFKKLEINSNGSNHINHFWMSGYKQIFEKHIRYLKNEGSSRFDSGQRTTILKICKTPFRQFIDCYFKASGYRDGFIGLFLSIFRAWYFTAANFELYKYQNQIKQRK